MREFLQEATRPFDSKKNVWIPDEEEGYTAAEIKSTKDDVCIVVTSKGNEVCRFRHSFDFFACHLFITIWLALTVMPAQNRILDNVFYRRLTTIHRIKNII